MCFTDLSLDMTSFWLKEGFTLTCGSNSSRPLTPTQPPTRKPKTDVRRSFSPRRPLQDTGITETNTASAVSCLFTWYMLVVASFAHSFVYIRITSCLCHKFSRTGAGDDFRYEVMFWCEGSEAWCMRTVVGCLWENSGGQSFWS